ncbi:MAG: hypothetical protein U9N87_05670, partial [Planctomycetota bacterium]|nr:hypothetical protein [Planctomycetota bacterium]
MQTHKAVGHAYRAFFDAADWLGMVLREAITATLYQYAPECISAAIPDYYATMKPRIEDICGEIAQIRDDKDIGRSSQTLVD